MFYLCAFIIFSQIIIMMPYRKYLVHFYKEALVKWRPKCESSPSLQNITWRLKLIPRYPRFAQSTGKFFNVNHNNLRSHKSLPLLCCRQSNKVCSDAVINTYWRCIGGGFIKFGNIWETLTPNCAYFYWINTLIYMLVQPLQTPSTPYTGCWFCSLRL